MSLCCYCYCNSDVVVEAVGGDVIASLIPMHPVHLWVCGCEQAARVTGYQAVYVSSTSTRSTSGAQSSPTPGQATLALRGFWYELSVLLCWLRAIEVKEKGYETTAHELEGEILRNVMCEWKQRDTCTEWRCL